jgi:hypothetical protein
MIAILEAKRAGLFTRAGVIAVLGKENILSSAELAPDMDRRRRE